MTFASFKLHLNLIYLAFDLYIALSILSNFCVC